MFYFICQTVFTPFLRKTIYYGDFLLCKAHDEDQKSKFLLQIKNFYSKQLVSTIFHALINFRCEKYWFDVYDDWEIVRGTS